MSLAYRSIRPAPDEYLDYYGVYISRVPDGDIVDTLSRQISDTVAFLRSIPESRGSFRYAPGKWSIREIIGHLSDSERVFSYRATCIARGDTTSLPGFDENAFVANAPFSRLSLADLTNELEYVRRSSLCMFSALDEAALGRRGTANGHAISVRALAFIMAGHEDHHMDVVRTRYLEPARHIVGVS